MIEKDWKLVTDWKRLYLFLEFLVGWSLAEIQFEKTENLHKNRLWRQKNVKTGHHFLNQHTFGGIMLTI